MKKKILSFFILFFGDVFSQDFSIGFIYSNLLTSKNYESVSIYSLEGEYEFLENTLSAGFAASYIDARINNNFIKNPPQDNPIENTFKLGLQGKYFPYFYKNDSFTIKPYIGIELGLYTST
ncbi:MAG: hypothetical protein H6613_06340 [Ignavibacteriales bacterium]|nr:hypothetical protein [Ignavibacteriales bacterium]